MVFSSISFLFFFLPSLLVVYFLCPKRYRNNVLLIFSLIFYFLGEKWYTLLLILSCIVNYLCGLFIEKSKNGKHFLILGIVIDLLMLLYFKYTNFFLETFSNLFGFHASTLKIVLPLGISFFTFQNLSYLIDVYRSDVEAEKNFFTYLTYISLFPQLIAGPIVRYKDVKDSLMNRKENLEKFGEGAARFIVGLGKKVLVADTIYAMINTFRSSDMSSISYYLVALGFTLQIYYDFSGYSDMAIGLGKMFGFNFKENFDYPLISKTVKEFWNKWHMSLSSFFRDYVYFPLGGSRKGTIKTIRNMAIVWLLTGLWHGANWNFVIWGIYFFVALLLERFLLKKHVKNGFFTHIYTFIIILVSFVIFSLTDLNEILAFFKGFLGIGVDVINGESLFILKNNIVVLLVALIGISPKLKNKIQKLEKGKYSKLVGASSVLYIFIIFLLSIVRLVGSSFSPFIYFRF